MEVLAISLIVAEIILVVCGLIYLLPRERRWPARVKSLEAMRRERGEL
jgi:hypothetical protein